MTPFRALPAVRSHLYGLTVSGNGQLVGFITNACQQARPQPNYFGVTNIRTGHTTRWIAPAGSLLDTVSLTADGKQLCYNVREDGSSPSVVRVIPTGAAPGRAADIGRTVAEAPSGRSIFFAAISPDGGQVYFLSLKAPVGNPPWSWAGQIHVVNLATGQSRLAYASAGKPDPVASDPAVRYLLLQIRGTDAERVARLVRLDLATGKATGLPAAKFRLPAILYW